MPATLTLRLTIADPLPGVRYSLQDKANTPVDAVTATEASLTFDCPVSLSPDGRLTGRFIRREGSTRRFVYIAIGKQAGDAGSDWDRRAKIDVHDIPAGLLKPGATLAVTLSGRGKDGTPACATVRACGPWRAV